MSNRDPYRWKARLYDPLIGPMQDGVIQVAMRVLPPHPGWRVLDVGCGTGATLAAYREAGCVVAGVDASPAMLAQASARLAGDGELRRADATALPFPDDSFDLATASMMLHEVPAEDRDRVLEEMTRVVRGRGQILVTDYRFGPRRGWRGRAVAGMIAIVERVSGHHAGYRSFRATGGLAPIACRAGLTVVRERPIAGGALAVSVLSTGERRPDRDD